MTKAADIISLNEELPSVNVPDIPTWSENYCWTGYDYKNHVGYWLHLGRWIEDPKPAKPEPNRVKLIASNDRTGGGDVCAPADRALRGEHGGHIVLL